MAELLARRICAKHIHEEELFGKKHSDPAETLPLNWAGGIDIDTQPWGLH